MTEQASFNKEELNILNDMTELAVAHHNERVKKLRYIVPSPEQKQELENERLRLLELPLNKRRWRLFGFTLKKEAEKNLLDESSMGQLSRMSWVMNAESYDYFYEISSQETQQIIRQVYEPACKAYRDAFLAESQANKILHKLEKIAEYN